MGLDSVELLMDIESTFQVTFSDSEAENSRTVGDIYELVLQKIDYSKNNKCKSQILFYKIREVIGRHCSYDLKKISPKTKLNHLFDKKSIREKWSAIQDELFIKLPDLTRAKWINKLLSWMTALLVSLSIVFIYFAVKNENYIPFIYACMLISIIFLSWVLTRHKGLP